jgi:NitT/TauT family transport system substrate-binding protein
LSNAPTLMAIGMGYFKEAGLDVDVRFFQGSSVMMPQVTQKHIQFGWVAPDTLIVSQQPGRDALPVKMFYNGIYLSPYEVVVLKSSPLQGLQDLKGKKIGVGAMAWANLPATKAMLKDHQYELGKDYDFVPVGAGPSALRALLDGKIDALNLFDTFHIQMESSGVELRRLAQKPIYQELFSNGWVAHEDTLKSRPDLVVKFSKAAAQGVVACNANPQACVKNFWALYPNAKPSEGTEDKKMADAVAILKARLQTMLPAQGAAQMGFFTEKSWKDYVQVLHTGGHISTKDVDTSRLYTNEFVKDINNFDVAAVEAAAKAK